MAECPVCQAPIADDFGLIECDHCGAQLIVHVDGRVEHSQAGAEADDSDQRPYAPPPEHLPEPEPEFPPPEPDLIPDSEPEPLPEFAPEPLEPEPSPEPTPEYLPEPEPEPEVYQVQPEVDSPDLSDIARFGNSDSASTRDGHLRYTLRISGIDTADIRNSFREAITDRKFMWDTDQILRSIRNGEVSISNVAASKAYILVTRLRAMPIKVSWEQYAIHQT